MRTFYDKEVNKRISANDTIKNSLLTKRSALVPSQMWRLRYVMLQRRVVIYGYVFESESEESLSSSIKILNMQIVLQNR